MYGRIGHRLPLGFYGSVGAKIPTKARQSASAQRTAAHPRAAQLGGLLGFLFGVIAIIALTIASGSLILIPGLIVVVLWQISKGRKRVQAAEAAAKTKV
jgi:hypothetical protein